MVHFTSLIIVYLSDSYAREKCHCHIYDPYGKNIYFFHWEWGGIPDQILNGKKPDIIMYQEYSRIKLHAN